MICLTGAVPFGLLPRLVLSGRRRRAETALSVLREAFGREGVFVELSDGGTAGSRRRIGGVSAFAGEAGVPTIAAGEVAYLRAQDHRLHEVLVAASHLCPLPGPGYRPTDQL
jgi:DNA polymerase III alpha subunit